MRKDRNTFFAESNMNRASFNPGMMPIQQQYGGVPMMANPAPYQSAPASNSFYAGPNPGMMPMQQQYNTAQMNNVPMNSVPMNAQMPNVPVNSIANAGTTIASELESRLAKMERQIRRLETRINKLESSSFSTNYVPEEIETTNSSSMYMI